MQRRSTKQSPGPNAAERRFIDVVKQLPCICCGRPGPSIYDHIYGSSKKLYDGLERVLVGHYAGLPLCSVCDSVKTRGSRRAFEIKFGEQELLWLKLVHMYELGVPENVVRAIQSELSESTQMQIGTALQYMTEVNSKNF